MKMVLPVNWDRASEGNEVLCTRFVKRQITDGSAVLPYRLFIPKRKGTEASALKEFPLLIYLHGADAAGDDNEIQLSMHDIGTFPVRDDMQRKHPCYVLAPQYGEMKHWAMADVKDILWKLIEDTVNNNEDIDRKRIYIYGYSAGAVGLLRLLKEHDDIFAGAIAICGATGTWQLDNLLHTPLWMVHACDDTIVKSTYRTERIREPGNLGSRDIMERLGTGGYHVVIKEKYPAGAVTMVLEKGESNPDADTVTREDVDLRYTEYPEGYMTGGFGVNPHCSWVAVSDARSLGIWEWMFQKQRDI